MILYTDKKYSKIVTGNVKILQKGCNNYGKQN